MSQGTSAPNDGMYAWSQYHEHNGYNQNNYSTQDKSNGQMNSLPVQRFDSTHVSGHSIDPYATYSTASTFNYNPSAPSGSAPEQALRTPEIDDLYWQEDYNNTNTHLLNDSYGVNVNDHPSSDSFTDQLRSARNSLPSPESTNRATPEASGHSQKPSLNSTIFTSPLSSPTDTKRPLTSLNTAMLDMSVSETHEGPSVPSSSHLTSPSIHVSRHSRGDSPARTDFPRVGKKRSVSNLSQGEYFPEVSGNNTSNMLGVPHVEGEDQFTDEEEIEERQQRSGFDPAHRVDEEVLNFEEVQKQKDDEEKASEVRHWLQETGTNPSAGERRHSRALAEPNRIRSRSTGARPHAAHNPIFAAQQIPGPGQMIDEQSDYHYSTDSESSIAPEDHPHTIPAAIPIRQAVHPVPEEEEPLPKQFFRARPWQDPFVTHGPDNSVRYQPETSSAAIAEFLRRAKDYDSASRAATWGTSRRRLSDGDKESLNFGEMKTRHLSLSKRTRERGSVILHKVQEMTKEQLMKRSNSHVKRQHSQLHEHPELEPVQSPEPIDERSSSESMHRARQSSFPRPTLSPSISAGLLGATNSLTAVGAGSHGLAVESDHHEGLFRRTIRRVRSRSDVNKSPKSPHGSMGFTSMIAQQGGMPVPTLASPSQEGLDSSPHQTPPRPAPQPGKAAKQPTVEAKSPVKMDLSPQANHILPTLDGFKMQIVELNPRLEPYLVDRIAHDQLKRYKRLVKNRVDHMALVAENKCPSGNLCPATGGEAEILPSRPGGQAAANNAAQFKVAPGVDSDNEDSAFDGIVTPAAFPTGIPLPPTKKLPARFECPLCFQVKSFQKPSDWTKHVHEDIQPFTCTFPNCSEPKSFKRKADWVRHENERHRHLEWWRCNISECSHKCFRKDNFVQHLVREHKRKEPKVKGRGGGNAKGKGKSSASGSNQEEQEFWNLVDACRHEGASDARNEPCKFCNNPCASWKKLSVHVGKHMEQLAMPVLDLANRRNVTKDTIISPVEPLPARQIPYIAHGQGVTNELHTAVSPHTQSGASNYQGSSASHSPMVTNRGVPNQAIFQPTYVMNGMRQGSMTAGTYGQSGFSTATAYSHYLGPESATAYSSYPGQQVMFGQAQLSPEQYVPRMQGMEGNFVSMNGAFDNSPHQPYYSSPEMEHTYPYDINMIAMNGNMVIPGQQGTVPVTTQGMGGNLFLYSAQQGNQQQQYSPY